MAPLLRLLLTALLAAAAAAADCGSLDMRVDSAGPGTATVSLKPPEDATKIRFDYSTGKFPTVDEVELRSNMQRVNYVMKDLDPGTEYPLRVTPICGEYATCEGYSDCSITVKAQASQGHSCNLEANTDYGGNDMIFGQGGSAAAMVKNVGGAKQCCDACAAVKPNRPYNDVCTRFVYEESTDTCYFKAPGAANGRAERDGYTAGEVLPK